MIYKKIPPLKVWQRKSVRHYLDLEPSESVPDGEPAAVWPNFDCIFNHGLGWYLHYRHYPLVTKVLSCFFNIASENPNFSSVNKLNGPWLPWLCSITGGLRWLTSSSVGSQDHGWLENPAMISMGFEVAVSICKRDVRDEFPIGKSGK